jgi:hypothetical protein
VIIDDATLKETDRVILLDDGRANSQPPSAVLVTLISNLTSVRLVCGGSSGQPECYTESVDGAALVDPPITLPASRGRCKSTGGPPVRGLR